MFVDKILGKKSGEGHGRWGGVVGDAVLGANDGIITTFAVVAGVTGASLSPTIVIIIGMANIIADGISMAMGNYLGTKSELDFVKSERRREEWEVENKPEEETEEVRQIYRDKGFEGQDLERVVTVITADKKRWVDVMMKDELGLNHEETFKPLRSAVVTFVSFLAFGILPLLAYLPFWTVENKFLVTSVLTGMAIFSVGAFSGIVTKKNFIIAGIEMLFIGFISAASAYVIGALISKLV